MKKKILTLFICVVMLNSCGAVAVGSALYLTYEMGCGLGEIKNCDSPERKTKEEKENEKKSRLEASLPDGVYKAELSDGYFPTVTYEDKTFLKIDKNTKLSVPKRIVTKKFENMEVGLFNSGEYLFDQSGIGYPVAIKKVGISEKIELNNILLGKNSKYKYVNSNIFSDAENENIKYYLKKLSEDVYISFSYNDNLQEGTREYQVVKMILKLSESW